MLISIQVLRAVAAWTVVYQHIEGMYTYFKYEYHFNGPRIYNQILPGSYAVDIFFVVSGFIMFHSLANQEIGAREFFVKRLLRIVPAYWFYTLLTILLAHIYVQEFSSTGWNWYTLFASLLFIPSDNPSAGCCVPLLTVGWTLYSEMFFYAWLSLCIFCFGKFRFWACTIALIALPLIWNKEWIYASVLSNKLLFEFVYGIMLGYGYLRLKNYSSYIMYLIGAVFFVGFLKADLNYEYASSAFLLVGAILCFEPVLLRFPTIASALKHLGDTSYSTYLLHFPVICVLFHYFGNPSTPYKETLLKEAVLLVVFVLSSLSFKYIEAGAFQNFLKKRFWVKRESVAIINADVR